MKRARVLSVILAVLMAIQAGLGLAFPDAYRDAGYVRATWFGNDLVTLALAVPLLVLGLALDLRGSTRGRLLWLGALGYGVYNDAFYLFGAALNAFFPLYVAALTVAVAALVLALSGTDVEKVRWRFSPGTPVRLVGGYMMAVAVVLTGVWLALWALHVFAGRPLPGGDPEAFRIVAALDLAVMVPALGVGGALLWRRRPWGYVLAALAGVQSSLYLLLLTLNGTLFILRGRVEGPGEVPVWGTLAVATAVATALLLRGASRERS